MSTGAECCFVEHGPGRWYYFLEGGASSQWDWREGAWSYGPFATLEAALKHLDDNHANPGGYSTISHEGFKPDEADLKLIATAEPPGGRPGARRLHRYY